ncbi:FAM96B [Pyrrhoderma noxium]|uniref:FAM96B n=1 Tax=Pyrrhoderma noxium TaxID=2282107 RepID=A0A286UUQ2_9AGAM|nr:FAM96B [Pyrrhoderma noxium]
MPPEIYNANPTVFATAKSSSLASNSLWMDDFGSSSDSDESDIEAIDPEEIFDHIRSINDPEHPLTLEQLAVVSAPQVEVNGNNVLVEFTPTVPHCGASTLIGLSIRVRLMRTLPHRFKVDIRVKPGSHQSESALNKQLNDKERVAAALENNALLGVVEQLYFYIM